MALWNGTSINSTATAMLFNQLYNLEAINMISNRTGLLYLIRGKSKTEKDDYGGVRAKFDKIKKITGNKIEVKLLGKLVDWTSFTDITDEIATTTLANSADYWGAAEFNLGHFGYTHPIPDSEMDRIRGDEAKTRSFLGEVFKMLMASKEKYLATNLNATGAGVGGSRTVLGSWVHACSDGVTTGETDYATYGTISRTDSANADFRSYVVGSVGDLQLDDIQGAINQVRVYNGSPDLAPCGLTVYNKVQKLIQPYSQVDYDEKMAKFGAPHVRFAGVNFCLDGYTPSGIMGLLDSESWVWYEKETPFTQSGVMLDPSRNATHIAKFNSWEQVICIRPKSNAKLTGITS